MCNKVDFGASNFEATLQLQIEAKRTMLDKSVAFGVKFQLTTPNKQSKLEYILPAGLVGQVEAVVGGAGLIPKLVRIILGLGAAGAGAGVGS